MLEFDAIYQWWLGVLLVSCRLGGAFFATPFFTTYPVPRLAKICMLFSLSLLFSTSMRLGEPLPLMGTGQFLVAGLVETVIGLTLGFGIRGAFFSFELAGRIIEGQAGLSMAAFLNPASGERNSILGAAIAAAALTFFMLIDGHHALLRIFEATFLVAPIGYGWHVDFVKFSGYFAKMYLFGGMLGGPVALALWLVDMALAAMVRSMPQFNILFLSFPLKLLVTLVVLAMLVPHFSFAFITLLEMLKEYWTQILIKNG